MTRVKPLSRPAHPVEAEPTATMRDPAPRHARRAAPVGRALNLKAMTVIRPVAALAAVPRRAMEGSMVTSRPTRTPVRSPPAPLALRPAQRGLSESVELLSLPSGLQEEMLPVGQHPRDAAQVHIALVRMVRELGCDYRRWYGCALRTDAAAIERMQRHLLGRATEVLAGRADGRFLAPEVVRHGALLGEILARRTGARWLDLSGDQPGLWQMVLPPDALLSPIARVHRFLRQGQREQDLVAYYFDIESNTRG